MYPVKDHQAHTVPIPRTVVDELTDLQAQSAPSELVFPSAKSTPLRNRNFRRDSFDAATAALGLTITPRNLRDTAASLAIQAGASVVAVARLLGHESAATTLNHYPGLFPTDLDDVARAAQPRSVPCRCARSRAAHGSGLSFFGGALLTAVVTDYPPAEHTLVALGQ
jgi:integrase